MIKVIRPKNFEEFEKYISQPQRFAVIYKHPDGGIFLLDPWGSGINNTRELLLMRKLTEKDLPNMVVIDFNGGENEE